jgi:hypothetical protein
MRVMNPTNFCKDHMAPDGFWGEPVLPTEGLPPDERPPEAPEIPGRPIPARGPTAPALQVTPGIPGALTPGDTESVMERQAAWIVVYELRASHGLPNTEDAFT